MKFKKRIRGTPKQIGKPFPIGEKRKLPKLRMARRKLTPYDLPYEKDISIGPYTIHWRYHEYADDYAVSLWLGDKCIDWRMPKTKRDTIKAIKEFRKRASEELGKSERATEWYARRYPMMFRGGGKRAAYYGGKTR